MRPRNGAASLLSLAIAALTACTGPDARSTPASIQVLPPRRSWISAGLKKQDLLYVSNLTGFVTIYLYSQRSAVGTLIGFKMPMGECADNHGNVFITDYAKQVIVEYPHGGTKPIEKFNDAPDSPYTCSVDPTTGNLAVANDDGTSHQGNIAIWSAASGKRTTYTDSLLYNFEGCAYDSYGTLLVTNGAAGANGSSYFAWLPRNGTQLVNVHIPGPSASWKWSNVQGIQWDGLYFAIDDVNVYRISLLHGQAYYASETDLYVSSESGPYWIYEPKPNVQGTQIVGGFFEQSSGSVLYWAYPQGGYAIGSIRTGVDEPFGVTISLGK